MTERVAIVGEESLSYHGAAATLEAEGFEVTLLAAHPEEWLSTHPTEVAIVVDTELVDIWHRHYPFVSWFLLTGSEPPPQTFREAIKRPIVGVLTAEMTPQQLVATLRLGLAGHIVIPHDAASEIAMRIEQPPGDLVLTPTQETLLQDLAQGFNHSALASMVGLSERHTRRILHDLYRRLQVTTPTEALVKAVRWGIVR